jgi:DNA-binding transcriptional LysR family regulator
VQAEIELRGMRLVVAVAEERNFTRAAARCHVSQPVLSRQVKEVEVALGTPLFERQTRNVNITKAGRLFVREARRTLEQGHRAVSLVRALAKREERSLSIGFSTLADLPSFHALLERAQRSAPTVAITIRTAYTPELISGLLRGDIDLAVIDLPTQARGIRVHPLATEPLVAVLPETLILSKQPTIKLAELNTSPLILLLQSIDPSRAVIDRLLSSLSARAFKIHDARTVPELLDEVVLHGRVGLLRQSATRFQRQGVIYKPLSETIQVGCALAWRVDDRWPASISFRDALVSFSQRP